MAISNSIDFRGLTAASAVLRIQRVVLTNGPADYDKWIDINYAVYASSADYAGGEQPLLRSNLAINKGEDATSFNAFVTKMRQVNDDAYSAAYVAVKQLADWSGASDTDLGDET